MDISVYGGTYCCARLLQFVTATRRVAKFGADTVINVIGNPLPVSGITAYARRPGLQLVK
jgi:hypothetical protein